MNFFSVFGESPPEPAPPVVPPRNMNSMHHMEALGRRARLGYLESECESEPPYLPTMLTSTLNAYGSPGKYFTLQVQIIKKDVSLMYSGTYKNLLTMKSVLYSFYH